MNSQYHSEAKLPWSYDYPLANHIAKNNSYANREMPLSLPLPFFRVSSENLPVKGFKILPITTRKTVVIGTWKFSLSLYGPKFWTTHSHPYPRAIFLKNQTTSFRCQREGPHEKWSPKSIVLLRDCIDIEYRVSWKITNVRCNDLHFTVTEWYQIPVTAIWRLFGLTKPHKKFRIQCRFYSITSMALCSVPLVYATCSSINQ